MPLCQLRSVPRRFGQQQSSSSLTTRYGSFFKLTNFKVVLVRQGVVDRLNIRDGRDNLLGHLIHRSLHAGADLFSERLERDFPRETPSPVEFRDVCFDRLEAVEFLPLPRGIHLGTQDAVPSLRQGGVLVANKAPEFGTSTLQNVEAGDARRNLDALALSHIDLHISGFRSISQERVRMRFAVNSHPCPSVGDDVHVGNMDVFIGLNEVSADNGPEKLGRGDRVLLGEDKDGVLH